MARIFISYRRDDAAGYALMLNKALSAHFGADLVFMDIGGIPPGADFRQVINDAVGECSVLVALIGVHWLTLTDAQGRRRIDSPQDFVRLEISSALGREIPVIPALVRGAIMPSSDELPDDLSELGWRQAIELSDPRWDADVTRLIAALDPLVEEPPAPVDTRAPVVGARIEKPTLPDNFEPETVLIPAGPFVMGSDPVNDPQAFDNELPQLSFLLRDYFIGKYPVTVWQYHAFMLAGGYDQAQYWTNTGWEQRQAHQWTEPHAWSASFAAGDLSLPVVGVSWYEAYAYCQWLSVITGRKFQLPTETKWEKAARGSNNVIYPWGNRWLADRCNTSEVGLNSRTPVGMYSPKGDSPFGVSDMSGNVWEWCLNQWRDSYHDPASKSPDGSMYRAARGGSWTDSNRYARAACRRGFDPSIRKTWLGFRVVREA